MERLRNEQEELTDRIWKLSRYLQDVDNGMTTSPGARQYRLMRKQLKVMRKYAKILYKRGKL